MIAARAEQTEQTHVDRGSPALVGRVVAALATWCVAFGLFSLAQGERATGVVALSLGLVTLFVVAAAAVAAVGGDSTAGPAPASQPPSSQPSSGRRGLNSRRNGYGLHT